MQKISRSGLIIGLLVAQLLALLLLGICKWAESNQSSLEASSYCNWTMLLVSGLLVLSGMACVGLLTTNLTLTRGLAQLGENAARVRRRQSLLPANDDPQLSPLQKSLQEISMEISELQRKEQSLIYHALDVICAVGHDQTFQRVNPAAFKVWGYTPTELVGTKFTDLILEEDREESLKSLFGAEKSVDTLRFENRLRRKGGAIVHVLWSAHWSAADQALFCVAHDITARKLAEKMLEDSEQRIRQIFEDMPVGLIMANKLGIIEMSNPALNTMRQTAPEELIGNHIQIVLGDLFKPGTPPDYANLFGTLTDTSVWRKSGGMVPVQVSARELSVGTERKYLLVIIDTTEREKLEQIKQEFFAMVSHDLRSPLTSLLHLLDALEVGQLGELNDYGKVTIGKNSREIGRLIKLVDELLDIEKMKAGKFVIEAEMCLIDSIMEPSIAALDHFAQRREIKIRYKETGIYLFADSSLLIRVLVNLISNAVKFSPAKSVIDIEVNQVDSELVFSVKDQGRGVPADFRQKIFEPYEQIGPSGQSGPSGGRVQGTGLGLPICKMIVEQHGGRIWIESTGEKGSIFKFTIPRREVPL